MLYLAGSTALKEPLTLQSDTLRSVLLTFQSRPTFLSDLGLNLAPTLLSLITILCSTGVTVGGVLLPRMLLCLATVHGRSGGLRVPGHRTVTGQTKVMGPLWRLPACNESLVTPSACVPACVAHLLA